MLTTRDEVRLLGPADSEAFLALTAQDPVVNVFAAYRARATNLDPRWLGGDTGRLDALLRERYETAVVPGRWFEMPDHFRIGFGVPAEDFAEGLSRLASGLDDLR